jgi:WD40 repeat protein
MERLWAHREQPIPQLSAARSDTPESLERLFARMMSKTPQDRVSSLDELVTALEACLADHAAGRVAGSPSVSRTAPTDSVGQPPAEPGTTAGVISAIEAVRSARAVLPRLVWLIGAGVAALAGLLGLAVLLTHRPSEKDSSPNAAVTRITESAGNAPKSEASVAPPSPTVSPPAVATPEAAKPQVAPPEVIHPEAGALAADVARTVPKIPRKAEAIGLLQEFRGHQGRVNGAAVSADGSRALSGGQDRSVRLWDVAGGATLLRLDHDGPVTCVGMTPDGQLGISGSLDRTVRVWDLRPDRSLGVHRLEGHTGPVFAVALSPDRRLAVSGGGDRTVRIWDLQAGRPEGPPLMHESAVVALAISRGGIVLTGCEDATLWQWDLASRQRVRRLLAAWPVLCVALSPDGHQAVSGHPDGNLVLRNLDLGTEIGRMSAHGDYIRSVAFTLDGRRVLAGSQEGMLMLWDVESRRVSHRFQRPPERSAPAGQMDIAIFADGLHALTAETDGMVRLWGLPSPDDASAGLRDAPIGQR